MALEFMRKKSEDLTEYLIRLYENREKYGLSNQEVADLLNREEDVNYDESKWRKEFQAWKNRFEAYVSKSFHNADEYNQNILDKYELLRIESEKEKIRYRDQRNEYTKLIRNEARKEMIRDIIKESVTSLPASYNPIEVPEGATNEVLLNLADWHVGTEFHGRFNSYDIDIFHERLDTLIAKAKEFILKNPTKKLHIASLGDMISGELRVSNRVENQEHLVNQIKIASEGLAKLISELAPLVEHTEFYYTGGNHGRSNMKELASGTTDENYERLIVWFLRERLRDFDNINITEDLDGIIEAEVNGYDFLFLHGDLDRKANVSKLSNLLQTNVDYACMGHTHNFHSEQMLNTRLLVTSSMMGADAYSTRGRFGNQVAQTIVNVVRTPQGMDDEIKILTL